MAPSSIPSEVHDVCKNFVSKHSKFQIEVIPDLLSHDRNWKDSKEILLEVTIGILNTLSNSWENSAFGFKFVDSLNEGTYVTNVIVSAIQATLKNLLFEKCLFISRWVWNSNIVYKVENQLLTIFFNSERQSTASTEEREKDNWGGVLI